MLNRTVSPLVYPGLKPGMVKAGVLSTDRMERIISIVCHEFGVNPDAIATKCRRREFAEPRHVVAWMIRRHTNIGVIQIGRRLKRDHTTIIHSTAAVNNLIHTDQNFKARIERLEAIL